jgi:glycine betaine/proline transport system ATP-binding protein
MIMRRRTLLYSEGDLLWLDAARRYRLQLSASGEALGLQVDGVLHALRAVTGDDDTAHSAPALAVAPSSLSLRSIIQLRQNSGHPVLIAEDGHIVGVCGEAEIIHALAARSN